MPLVLVRLINKEAYGVYLQFLFIGQFLATILVFTIPSSLYFFFPNSGKKLNQLISQTYFSIFLIAIIFIPLYYFFGFQFSVFFEEGIFGKFYVALGFFIFFITVSTLTEHLFVIEKRSDYVIYYNIIFSLTRILSLMGSFLIFKSIFAMMWALVIIRGLMSIFLFVYLRRNYSISPYFKHWNKSYLVSQVRYTLPLGMASIVNQIGKKIDRFILSVFFSSGDFAIYSIANYKVPIVNLLFPSVSNVIIPQIAKNREEGNIEEVKRLWHKMIVVLGNITIPTVIYFFLIARPLITFLFTDQYVDAVNVYRIFLLSMLILILRGTTIILSYGYTKFILYIQVFYMIFSIITGYFLIKSFGLYGGAFTFLLLSSLREIALIYKSKQILNLSFSGWMPWRKLGSVTFYSLIPAPAVIAILFLSFPDWSSLILTFTIYAGVLLYIYHKVKIIDIFTLLKKLKYRLEFGR